MSLLFRLGGAEDMNLCCWEGAVALSAAAAVAAAAVMKLVVIACAGGCTVPIARIAVVIDVAVADDVVVAIG